jgi:hypothetical protein
VKLLIMKFSPTSRHFVSLRSRYSPQQPVLKLSQSVISSLFGPDIHLSNLFSNTLRLSFRLSSVQIFISATCSQTLSVCNFVSLRSRYSSQQPVLKHSQSVISSLFGPDIHLSNLFSNTLSLCSSSQSKLKAKYYTHLKHLIIISFMLLYCSVLS